MSSRFHTIRFYSFQIDTISKTIKVLGAEPLANSNSSAGPCVTVGMRNLWCGCRIRYVRVFESNRSPFELIKRSLSLEEHIYVRVVLQYLKIIYTKVVVIQSCRKSRNQWVLNTMVKFFCKGSAVECLRGPKDTTFSRVVWQPPSCKSRMHDASRAYLGAPRRPWCCPARRPSPTTVWIYQCSDQSATSDTCVRAAPAWIFSWAPRGVTVRDFCDFTDRRGCESPPTFWI